MVLKISEIHWVKKNTTRKSKKKYFFPKTSYNTLKFHEDR